MTETEDSALDCLILAGFVGYMIGRTPSLRKTLLRMAEAAAQAVADREKADSE